MKKIKILEKTFELFISSDEIDAINKRLAQAINRDFNGREVMFLPILNGAFIFAADLIRQVNLSCNVSFLKLASYKGVQSAGDVVKLIGINENLRGKVIIIIEDIIDTGITISELIDNLKEQGPAEINIVTLLYKPDKCVREIKIDYLGKEIGNRFVVGYGLDYNGFGRNLPDIYQEVVTSHF
ncbi:MAG: hypoxanthine phosphoribosyltransferase [Bacteroidota bacterium]